MTWTAMRQRCINPTHTIYHKYGGRGIRVCDEWACSFQAFLNDMGPRPEGTTIDRFPDKNGNYEPSNCRWATAKEQRENTRRKDASISEENRRFVISPDHKLLLSSTDPLDRILLFEAFDVAELSKNQDEQALNEFAALSIL